MWEQIASKLEREEDVFIDWDERFFICPVCAEPVYEEDMIDDTCPSCKTHF